MIEWIKGSALAFIGVVVAGIALLALAFMAVFGVGFFQRSTAGFRGQTSAIEKTKANGNFRIAAYDQFFDLCNAVKATEGKLVIADQAVTDFKGTDQENTAIANKHAIESQRVTLANEYNNKASRSFTEGQFRDSKLPYQIDLTQENTQCA